ncbi:MAG: hypothetical protein QOD75_2847 [Blastocatellia bacterium]|jgi:hypothetical protein|nr:hypothetical protein [Blastocatellia bacterium]
MKIKYLAVLVAAIVHWLLGGVWYGVLFKNPFMTRITPQQLLRMEGQNEGMALGVAFVMSLLLCYILAHFIHYTKARSAMAGAQTAFWLWLGFIFSTNIATVLFEARPRGLFAINVAYQLVACIIAGIILAVWRPREVLEA